MFDWLKLILGRQSPRRNSTSRTATGPDASDKIARRVLGLNDAEHIETALAKLKQIGLTLTSRAGASLPATASKIVEQWQGISFSREPTPGNWALIALTGEIGAFENAAFFQDHCFDGYQLESYSNMIAGIVKLAGNQWPIEGVDVEHTRAPNAPNDQDKGIRVTIKSARELAPFVLTADKDFDWSLIYRLNERLPNEVAGRFAVFLDGNATIVFLTPEEIVHLNTLCGYKFFYDEASEDLGPQN